MTTINELKDLFAESRKKVKEREDRFNAEFNSPSAIAAREESARRAAAIKAERERREALRGKCGFCGCTVGHGVNNVDEVTIAHENGSAYEDSGYIEEEQFFVCGKCFKKTVRPWLIEQGLTPCSKVTDW